MPTPEELQNDVSYRPIDNQNLNAQAVYNPNRKKTADELLQELYKKNIPEPTFDQDKADRLQRMGRINQLGRSINVLGDIFGTAIGANTRRRHPDTTAPALYQSYQANLDKYKAEKDANLLRDYDKDRQDIITGISRADRQEDIDIAQKRFDAQQRYKEAQQKLEWQKYLAGLTQKERELAIAQQNADSNRIRANKAGAKEKKNENDDKVIATKYGTVTLTPDQASYIRDNALKNSAVLEKRYPNLYEASTSFDMQTGKMVNQKKLSTRVKDDDLIRAYLEMQEEDKRVSDTDNLFKSEQFKQGEKAALDQRRKEKTVGNPVQQATPNANKTSIYTF